MAFPSSLDTLKTTWAWSEAPVWHSNHHNDMAVLVLAMMNKIGVNGSSVVSSLDWKMTNHNHDSVYSLLTHNHAGVYSDIAHNHTGVYATAAHTHTGVYADAVHVHTNYNIVKNGTFASISSSVSSAWWDVYSSSTDIIATPTIARIVASAWTLTTCYLYRSSDNVVFTTVQYQVVTWTSLDLTFVLQEWFAYKTRVVTTGFGWWVGWSSVLSYTT